MNEFADKLAVITGAGEGTGREIAVLLAGAGCDLAICDVSTRKLAQTRRLCEAAAEAHVKVSTHLCNVSDEKQLLSFAKAVKEVHATPAINFLFNYASIGGGRSFIKDSRADWERCFNICWYGVYNSIRTFQPLLMASDHGHIINSSGVNDLWARAGDTLHSAYATANSAIKGFSQTLAVELRSHAPHLKVSVVMLGDIETAVVQGAPKRTSAEEAANIILEGVCNGQWLI